MDADSGRQRKRWCKWGSLGDDQHRSSTSPHNGIENPSQTFTREVVYKFLQAIAPADREFRTTFCNEMHECIEKKVPEWPVDIRKARNQNLMSVSFMLWNLGRFNFVAKMWLNKMFHGLRKYSIIISSGSIDEPMAMSQTTGIVPEHLSTLTMELYSLCLNR